MPSFLSDPSSFKRRCGGGIRPVQDGGSSCPKRTAGARSLELSATQGPGGSRSTGKAGSCDFGQAPQGGGATQQRQTRHATLCSKPGISQKTGTWCPKGGAVKSHPGPCPHLKEQMRPAPVESPSEGHLSNRIPVPKSQMSATAEGRARRAQVVFQVPAGPGAWGSKGSERHQAVRTSLSWV